MLEACHTRYKEWYYKFFSTAQKSFTTLDHNYSLQIGHTDTTMKQRWGNNGICITISATVMYRHARPHENRRNTNSNTRWWALRHPGRTILLHCPSTAEVQKYLQPYWSYKDKTAIMDGISMRSRGIIVPALLQDKALKHLHLNHICT